MSSIPSASRRWRTVVDDSGVTLIELVMASSILFIAAMGVITALGFAAASSQQSALRSRALNLANERIEKARDIPYDNVGVVYEDGTYGDPPGNIPAVQVTPDGVFLVETQVDWSVDATTGRAEYKNMRITVSWQNPRPGSVSIASALYGASALTNNGDLKVFVKEMGTTTPIDMAQVWVTPYGSVMQRHRWTGADGTALFGVLPIGNAQVVVSASGWVFDPIAPAAVQPDLLTSVYVYGYRPCTAVITVTDTTGTPLPYAVVRLTNSRTPATSFTGYADSNGVVTITGLLPDRYSVRVSCATPPCASATGVLGPMTSGGTYTDRYSLAPIVPGSLSVLVKNSAGTVLPGATVRVFGPSPDTGEIVGSPVTSASSGYAIFPSLVGTYTVTTSLDTYNTNTVTGIVVLSGVDYPLTVTLSPYSATGSLKIVVKHTDGSVNPHGPRVQWRPISGSSTNQDADSQGLVLLSGVVPGSYEARVQTGTNEGSRVYSSWSSATVVAGEQAIINLTSNYEPH
jgi:Tfp pilus assembly protein PilV